MIDVLSVLISAALFYWIGYNQAKIKDQLEKFQQEEKPTITSANTKLIKEYYQSDAAVGIATPKSPQLIEFEEEEALRKLNASYRG